MEVIKGIPVSSGVVIGSAFVLDEVRERVPYHTVGADDVDREIGRLDEAIALGIQDVEADRDRAARELGPEPAKIFEFHLGLLHDATLIEPIRQRIRTEQVTAPYAVAEAFRGIVEQFRAMGSEVFRQKASDVLDLDRRILGHLVGQTRDRLDRLEHTAIVIAHELTTSQAASLDLSKVRGLATDAGGRTDHTSIVAAALGVPVVVGCQQVTHHVHEGDRIILDGTTGVVIIRPDSETLER
ncbi:MAG: phosphoenolpyruvate-utilizing N-terminal domain-containing protein, partial [Planctomycetota bacterium]